MPITLRFIFISEADKPTVTLKVPEDMLFQEAFVLAAKRQGKDAGILTATYPGGSPIAGGTVGEVSEKSTNIHVIDPSIVGGLPALDSGALTVEANRRPLVGSDAPPDPGLRRGPPEDGRRPLLLPPVRDGRDAEGPRVGRPGGRGGVRPRPIRRVPAVPREGRVVRPPGHERVEDPVDGEGPPPREGVGRRARPEGRVPARPARVPDPRAHALHGPQGGRREPRPPDLRHAHGEELLVGRARLPGAVPEAGGVVLGPERREGHAREGLAVTERYARLRLFGHADLTKLADKRVAIVGVGGLGALSAEILARLGVGDLVLFDYDTVEEANLNRLVYRTDQVGEKKVEAIRDHLKAANPDVRVTSYPHDVTDGGGLKALLEEIPSCDLVLGCVDSFAVRIFLNAKCVDLRVPFIDGGASEDGVNGSVHVVIPGKTACYRCNRPAMKDTST